MVFLECPITSLKLKLDSVFLPAKSILPAAVMLTAKQVSVLFALQSEGSSKVHHVHPQVKRAA